jgi:hypothetical protein
MSSKISEYLASIGKKGGEAKGPSKARGDADYYKKLAAKAAAARKKKAKDR